MLIFEFLLDSLTLGDRVPLEKVIAKNVEAILGPEIHPEFVWGDDRIRLKSPDQLAAMGSQDFSQAFVSRWGVTENDQFTWKIR